MKKILGNGLLRQPHFCKNKERKKERKNIQARELDRGIDKRRNYIVETTEQIERGIEVEYSKKEFRILKQYRSPDRQRELERIHKYREITF